MAKNSTDGYEALKTAMKDIGLLPDSGNLSKFSTTVNGITIRVAVHIPTGKVICKIGENEYTDDIYQYQVWAEKGNHTVYSISGGGKGEGYVSIISAAASEVKGNCEPKNQ